MIDWKKRISKDEKYADMRGLPYYTLKWDNTSELVDVYEYKIHMPAAPPDEHCVGYGLPENDQKFYRTEIPKQVRFPEKDYGRDNWTPREIEAFIDAEWNRRRQGIWMFIKGKKTYIPGILYMKMNYWKALTGVEFIYRFSDWEFAVFWFIECVMDPKCVGMTDYKCRQVGDTEWAILIMWEYGSRVRGTLNANQSCINEGHAVKTYKRLVYGHKHMIYYFRPLNQGTEDPKKGLNLSYPAQHITYAAVKSRNEDGQMANKSSHDSYEFPEVGSQFYYGPSKVSEFDGTTLGRAYLDEHGKSDGKLNPVEWIQVISEATYSNITQRKMGMILMTTTVEEITPEGLDWAQTIWREADPNKKTNGRTVNGLKRCFRNVVDRGEVDRWGFPYKEKIITEVKAKYNAMIAVGNTRGAVSYLRKNPIDIDDVFRSAANESQFHIENLQKREFYLNEQADPKPWVRGNLRWKDGVPDTEVVFERNPKGKWIISKHPHDFGLEANRRATNVFNPKPGNTHFFCAGVDPIDQKDTLDANPSKGAICVMRKFDDTVDKEDGMYYTFNDEVRGIVKGQPVDLGSNFQTNRVCATYTERPTDPAEFFEDVILTMVYFGSDFLPEKNKYGGLSAYLNLRGYQMYEMDKPTTVKNYKGQSEKGGVTATEGSINMYFDFITSYTCTMCNALDHPDLVLQLLTMNWKNRGKRDLGVAFGWALYASHQKKPRWHGDKQKREVQHFTEYVV